MNLLLLHPTDLIKGNKYVVQDRRHRHLITHLKSSAGDQLKAGLLNGELGTATVHSIDSNQTTVCFQATHTAPAAQPITLLLALPRPKMLRRILIDATTLGIKHIILVNSYKVEKSYWSTPFLHTNKRNEIICLALEQACDTAPPTIQLEQRFKPFVEDRLPELMKDKRCLLAHPGEHAALSPPAVSYPSLLAIGPEGGWTDYECSTLIASGFVPFSFGQRILRVETAVASCIGRLLAI